MDEEEEEDVAGHTAGSSPGAAPLCTTQRRERGADRKSAQEKYATRVFAAMASGSSILQIQIKQIRILAV